MADFSDFQKLDIRVGKVIGVSDEEGRCILIAPDKKAPPGSKPF